jgi:hypothetical protein
VGPTIGSYGGHWWGNISDTRYDVFPSGSYYVGDEWRRVSNQVDLGGIQISYEYWENIESPICCAANLFCSDPPGSGWYVIEGCNPITGGPKKFRRDIFTYVPNWFTDYERFKYEYFQWSLLGGFRVSGRLYS